MSETQDFVYTLNIELEKSFQKGEPILVGLNNIRALALVASLDPLAYVKYPKRHRPKLVGEFVLRSFLLSTQPVNNDDTWNTFPVVGETNSMYMVSFGPHSQNMLNQAARLVGLIE